MDCVSLRQMPISNTYKIQRWYEAKSVKRKRILWRCFSVQERLLIAHNTGLTRGAFSNYIIAAQREKEIKKLSYSLFQFTDYLLGWPAEDN